MFGKKKVTHVLSHADGVPRILGGPIAIYGRKDLKTRLEAAKAAGVPVSVRKLKRGER